MRRCSFKVCLMGILLTVLGIKYLTPFYLSVCKPCDKTTDKPCNTATTTKHVTQHSKVKFEVEEIQTLHTLHNITHTKRIQHLLDKCKTKDSAYNRIRAMTRTFYYIKKYNLTYCKVPKAGCTFWSQAFDIFKHGADFQNTALKKSRMDIHFDAKVHQIEYNSMVRSQSRLIIVSRDPYSRLFSAYTDKVFLETIPPGNLGFQIRKQANQNKHVPVCQTNVTFHEFLTYVISVSKAGQALEPHWTPIYTLCKPCESTPFILLKQESFATDVEYTLKKIGVEKDIFNALYEALHSRRIEATIPGIVEETYKIAKTGPLAKCVGLLEVARRVWKVLQIQGFLGTVEFPVQVFGFSGHGDVSNASYVSEVILDTIKTQSLSTLDSKMQRQTALVNAYKLIPDDVIKGIQELYKMDFELFDYSYIPPKKVIGRYRRQFSAKVSSV